MLVPFVGVIPIDLFDLFCGPTFSLGFWFWFPLLIDVPKDSACDMFLVRSFVFCEIGFFLPSIKEIGRLLNSSLRITDEEEDVICLEDS